MHITSVLLAAAALVGMAQSATKQASPPPQSVATTLAGHTECVSFRWEPDAVRKGAISIPVTLNGRELWLQLDTGTNTDIVYGDIADKAGWAPKPAKSFRASELTIGSTRLRGAPVAIYRDQPAEQTAGEIGLADLVGRTTIIDYASQRFCLFEPGKAPSATLSRATWAEAALRNGKLFIPMSVGEAEVKDAIFDTGSSEFPLWVDLPLWQQITGVNDPAKAPKEVRGKNFNKPVVFKGAPTTNSMKIGTISVGSRIAYTKVGDPNMFATWPYSVAAIVGNEPFWNGVVIIDLSDARTRFGFVTTGS